MSMGRLAAYKMCLIALEQLRDIDNKQQELDAKTHKQTNKLMRDLQELRHVIRYETEDRITRLQHRHLLDCAITARKLFDSYC